MSVKFYVAVRYSQDIIKSTETREEAEQFARDYNSSPDIICETDKVTVIPAWHTKPVVLVCGGWDYERCPGGPYPEDGERDSEVIGFYDSVEEAEKSVPKKIPRYEMYSIYELKKSFES